MQQLSKNVTFLMNEVHHLRSDLNKINSFSISAKDGTE